MPVEEWESILERRKSKQEQFEKDDEIEKKIREEMRKISDRPITEEDIEKIQKNINLAREDIDVLSERIIKKVWGKE